MKLYHAMSRRTNIETIDYQRIWFQTFFDRIRGIKFRHGILPKLKMTDSRYADNPGGDQFEYPDRVLWIAIHWKD